MTTRGGRGRLRSGVLAVATLLGVLVALGGTNAWAAFVATTSNDGNAISASPGGTYLQAVLADGATSLWRLGEPSGTTAHDIVGDRDFVTDDAVGRGTSGAINGEADTASTFTGGPVSVTASGAAQTAPNVFTVEAWFKTGTTRGGRILGFGEAAAGTSFQRDRFVYMRDDGRVTFGVNPGPMQLLTTLGAFNDNQWHHVVATLSPTGMALYVDGVREGRNTAVTTGQQGYTGHWRVGGDDLSFWPMAPQDRTMAGAIDEFAVYPSALSENTVRAHYIASGRTVDAPVVPADTYGSTVWADNPLLYWRMDETSGIQARDAVRNYHLNRDGTVTAGSAGVPSTGPSRSATFTGTGAPPMSATGRAWIGQDVFSAESWIKTGTTRGGRIMGFGEAAAGTSFNRDRFVYMRDDGRITFGATPQLQSTVTSPAAYNDNQWHHVIATMSSAGMVLYVDGVRVGRDTTTTAGQQGYTGHWRVGGDDLTFWPLAPQDRTMAGAIDEVAVYGTALSDTRVIAHYQATGRAAPPASGPTDTYGRAVWADNPELFWRLGEGAGNTLAREDVRGQDQYLDTSMLTRGVTGLTGAGGNLATRFTEGTPPCTDGTFDCPQAERKPATATGSARSGPQVFTTEAWINTTTTRGGRIMGFGDSPTKLSLVNRDRFTYMRDDGKITFAVFPGVQRTVTSGAAYNDGQWHHVVATLSGAGMQLYVDGSRVAVDATTTVAQSYSGYWRVGGDTLVNWPSAPADETLVGDIDEVAVYLSALSPARISAHNAAGR